MEIFDNDELLALAKLDLAETPAKLEDALRKLKQILNSDSPDIEAFAITGRIYAQLNLLDKAKRCFQTFLEKEPGALAETFQFGMVHFDQGDNDTAANIWSTLLEREPTFPPALFYMALIHANNNALDKARHALDVLLKSAPTDNLYFERGRDLLNQLERGEHLSLVKGSENNAEASSALPKDAYKSIN